MPLSLDVGYKRAGPRGKARDGRWRSLPWDDHFESHALEHAAACGPVGDPEMGYCRSFLAYAEPHTGRRSRPDNRGAVYRWYWDLDSASDRERARSAAIVIMDWLQAGGVTPRIRFSGSKGFGVEVYFHVFAEHLQVYPQVHLLAGRFHDLLLDEIRPDGTVVDRLTDRRRLIQREGVRHPETGLYSTPLAPDELRTMSLPDIEELARTQRVMPRPDWPVHERMSELWNEAVQTYQEESAPFHRRLDVEGLGDLPQVQNVPWGHGVTPCVASLLQGAPRNMRGERNSLVYSLAILLKSLGGSSDEVEEFLSYLAERRIRSRERAHARERAARGTARSVCAGSETMRPVTCSVLRGRGLRCTDRCPWQRAQQTDDPIRRRSPSRREDHTPPDRPEGVTIDECRDEIDQVVSAYMLGDDTTARLVRVPAGGGKTFTTLQSELRTVSPGERVAYIAPRHELISQANAWFGGQFAHIFPRMLPESAPENLDQEHHCCRGALAAELSSRGFEAVEVCRSCEHRASHACGYLQQFGERGHWGLTHAMALGVDFAEARFELIVIDEAILGTMAQTMTVDVPTIRDTVRQSYACCTCDPREACHCGAAYQVDIVPKASIKSAEPVFPDGETVVEVGFDDPVLDAWRVLHQVLTRVRAPSDSSVRGAELAVNCARAMRQRGVDDPESAIRQMLERGVVYREGAFSQLDLLPQQNWIEPLLRGLLHGMTLAREHPDVTGAIPLRANGGDPVTYSVGTRQSYRTGDRRVVCLDATGSPELYERLLGRSVVEHPIHVPNDARQVTQITDAVYAQSSLLTPNRGIRRRTVERLLRVVREMARTCRDQDFGEGKTLLVCHMAVETWLRAEPAVMRLMDDGRLELAHYWGQRGRDYSECDQVILLGYPYPHEEAVYDAASVLYAGDDLDFTAEEQWRPYRHGDGRTGIEMRVYRDARIQAVQEQLREAEFYQAAMRVRPLGSPHKRVLVLTQNPMRWEDGLEVGRLVEVPDLSGAERERYSATVRAVKLVKKVMAVHGWVPESLLLSCTEGDGGDVFSGPRACISLTGTWPGKYLGGEMCPHFAALLKRFRGSIRWDISDPRSLHDLANRVRPYVLTDARPGLPLDERVFEYQVSARVRGERGRPRTTTVWCRGPEGVRRSLRALLWAQLSNPDVIYALDGDGITQALVEDRLDRLDEMETMRERRGRPDRLALLLTPQPRTDEFTPSPQGWWDEYAFEGLDGL